MNPTASLLAGGLLGLVAIVFLVAVLAQAGFRAGFTILNAILLVLLIVTVPVGAGTISAAACFAASKRSPRRG